MTTTTDTPNLTPHRPCPSWCVRHLPADPGTTLHAADLPGDVSVGREDGGTDDLAMPGGWTIGLPSYREAGLAEAVEAATSLLLAARMVEDDRRAQG